MDKLGVFKAMVSRLSHARVDSFFVNLNFAEIFKLLG